MISKITAYAFLRYAVEMENPKITQFTKYAGTGHCHHTKMMFFALSFNRIEEEDYQKLLSQ